MRQARASGRIAPFTSTIRPVRAPTPASSWAASGGGRCAAWGIAVYCPPAPLARLTPIRAKRLPWASRGEFVNSDKCATVGERVCYLLIHTAPDVLRGYGDRAVRIDPSRC